MRDLGKFQTVFEAFRKSNIKKSMQLTMEMWGERMTIVGNIQEMLELVWKPSSSCTSSKCMWQI